MFLLYTLNWSQIYRLYNVMPQRSLNSFIHIALESNIKSGALSFQDTALIHISNQTVEELL
jgi:hypothetical protein